MDEVVPFLIFMWVLIGGAWLTDKALAWIESRRP